MNRTLTIFNILKGIDLKGGTLTTYSRFPNSFALDVVVCDKWIDIHATNRSDNTQPNLPDMKYALDQIITRLGFLNYTTQTQKNNDGYWFTRFEFDEFDTIYNDAIWVRNTSTSDGYGGAIVNQTTIGNVTISFSEVKADLQLKGGEYKMYTDAVIGINGNVQKNDIIRVNGKDYQITAIIENKVYATTKN